MIHVMPSRCETCIFRAGNLMHLQRGRVRDMVDEVKRTDGCIPCHKTLAGEHQAICRGQFDLHPTQPIQVAQRLGLVRFEDPRPAADITLDTD
jgi:hypothetical protein